MKIKIEVSVPVDDKRNIWLTGEAEGVEVDDVGKVTAHIAEGISGKAIELYDQAVPPSEIEDEAAQIVRRAKEKGKEEIPPSQRRPRPEDPDSMKTFGDDD